MKRNNSIARREQTMKSSRFNANEAGTTSVNLLSIALAMICCCIFVAARQAPGPHQIDKARPFLGQWTAASPGRDGIARLEIGSNATEIFIRAWALCPQGECDWGRESIDISAVESGVLSVTFAPSGRTSTLRISLLPERRLRVVCHTTSSDSGLSHDRTQEFTRLPETWADVPDDARSAVWSSVVEFFARQSDGKVKRVGYGFLIKHDLVATAYSVVHNTTQLRARMGKDGEMTSVLGITKSDEAHNVCLVRVEGLGGWPLSLDDKSTWAIGEPVYVITDAGATSVSPLAIGRMEIVNGISLAEIAAPVLSNQSGAPVFNKRGLVVGISESNPDGPAKPGLVIPAMYITALVPDLATVQRAELQTAVDSRPTPLNSPQPRYTDEARNHGVEGRITARILVGSDGLVKQVKIVSGLPYGLDDEAIRAAFALRFKPAMKGGQPVAYWMTILLEFHLSPPPRKPF